MDIEASSSRVRPVRILLVEDNPGDVELTLEALAEGRVLNELHVVTDGAEALRWLRREGEHHQAPRPDIILLDLNLPRTDGREVLASVKGDAALRDIPVVILTTSEAEADILHAYRGHANAYIVKPMDLDRFLAAIRLVEQFWLELVALPSGWHAVPESLALPPAPVREPVVAAQRASAASPPDPELSPAVRSLLLVEDNPADAELIAEYLDETAPGKLTLETVPTLAAAKSRLRERGIDLVLLDLSLPDATGLDTFHGLYAEAPDTPIVVLTGLDDGRLALRAMQAGAQDYLVKGQIDGELLLRSIRYAAERAQGQLQLRQAQKMEAVGRLAGGVAHDFNNMLGVINGYTELLLTSCPESDPQREALLEIRNAGQRAAMLTRQLLAFGRRQVLRPERVEVPPLLSNLRSMLARVLGEHIRLVLEVEPGLEPIYADAGQIEQVILNLAFNARDAMIAGGELTLRAERVEVSETAPGLRGVRRGVYIRLTVHDTGTGISDEDRPHIFEPFFTTKEVGKGTGLGLASVYGIVRQSSGEIEVESSVGRGTTFRIYFPALKEAANDPHEETSPAPSQPIGSGLETILVLEDEPSLLYLIGEMLTAYGYRALLANAAGEAVRLAVEHPAPIHLLLADVVLPEQHGPEIAVEVQALRPGIRVLFMSGYADEELAGYGLSPDELVQKPFSHSALTARIRQVRDAG